MLWIKAFHIIFATVWFSALLYLPRLFVYHAMCEDEIGDQRLKVMERKLYWGIMMPGVLFTLFFGCWLFILYSANAMESIIWLQLKLILVSLLSSYHYCCGRLVCQFRKGFNHRSDIFYRWFNESPAILLILVVVLAVIRPFK
ncbi:MAG: CopD family protein [Piscirickettsiaceae bacterium]|nr:CopD family protein [Piscirickettsiaceae bacterium]